MQHTFTMSQDQAARVHKVIDDHCQTLKNWIASRVEADDLNDAKRLVSELRHYQNLYAAFNMTAKQERADRNNQPIETEHRVM